VAYTTLVTTDTLAAKLDDWAVVDCRYDLNNPDWGREQYLTGHIPGAVYASLSHDLSAARTGTNGRHPLPCPEDLELLFGRLGVAGDMQVVAYDQDTGMMASRLWWMLRYMGHQNVAVLDGGWAKWIREQRPARSGPESRPPAVFEGTRRKDMRLMVEHVHALLGDASALLVDARAAERFEGRSEPIDRTPGHIPGAVNRFYKDNVAEDGTMLPADRLRAEFQTVLRGHSPGEVVMYCGSGVTACHNLLAMEVAGLPGAKLYAGSWSEWSSDPSRPVETGPARDRPSR
jgi:thiosulfate/3-mercaptopyruvate sulfurtransferase